MSVYPDKRNGKPTGRWQVEVRRGNKTLRDRADTFAKAKEVERDFIERLKSGLESADDRYVPQQTKRLSDLVALSERHLWAGKREADENFKKLRFMVDVMGDVPIANVTTKSIDDLVIKLRDEGPKGRPLSSSTINRYLAAISKFLKWTIEHDYRREAMPKIHWCEEDEGRIRWLTPDEQTKLLSLLPDPFDAIVRIAIKTGMRKSEIYEAVAGEHAQVDKHHVRLWKTKNRTARSIPISEVTRMDFLHLRDVGMPSERQLQYAWDKAKKAMGLEDDEDFVFHCCRHTCATRMVEQGINPLTIKKSLGHKSIQTTLRYAHVSDNEVQKAFEKLDASFA